jgi:hypothetical protein
VPIGWAQKALSALFQRFSVDAFVLATVRSSW